jgi:hypothetical protein
LRTSFLPDQDRTADGLRPLHEVLGERAVPHDIELVPERGRGSRGDLLHAADRHRRLAERHADPLGGAGGLHLGTAGEHAPEADRRQQDRQGEVLPQHRRGQPALGHVAQHALAQPDAGQLARQPASGQLAVVTHGCRGQLEGPVTTKQVHGPILAADDPTAPEVGGTPDGQRPWRPPDTTTASNA